jgi:hypothetical protein
METTAFFEKKINLTPSDFNKVKTNSIEDLLFAKSKNLMENKCSEQGFVLPGSVKLISRSMGYFEQGRFTGDAVYYVKLEGTVVYPADSIRVIGEVIRKNKMGLYVDYRKAIRIQVPRDLHIGNMEYDSVDVGDTIEVELKRSKFQINDPYILASGIFVSVHSETGANTGIGKVEQAIALGAESEEENKEEEEEEEEAEAEESKVDESEADESEAEESKAEEAEDNEALQE